MVLIDVKANDEECMLVFALLSREDKDEITDSIQRKLFSLKQENIFSDRSSGSTKEELIEWCRNKYGETPAIFDIDEIEHIDITKAG